MLLVKLLKNKPNFMGRDSDGSQTQEAPGQARYTAAPMTEEERAALREKFRQQTLNRERNYDDLKARAAERARTGASTVGRQAEKKQSAPQPPNPPQAEPAPGKKAGKKVKNGRFLRIFGGAMAGIFGFASVMEFFEMISWASPMTLIRDLNPLLLFTALGAALLVYGISKGKKAKRLKRYQTLLGDRHILDLQDAARTTGIDYDTVLKDVQDMVDDGAWEDAYVDVGRGLLIVDSRNYTPPKAEPKQEKPRPEPEPDVAAEAARAAKATDNEILQQIKSANDAIDNEDISAKIDEIGVLTAKIFQLVDENPEKEQEIRSFTAYYLPQTLKILNAYARMEKQGVEGQNITEAKLRIEAMLDKLVAGYAAQLDKLFGSEVLDITTDITVMEQMLAKDGLAEDVFQP